MLTREKKGNLLSGIMTHLDHAYQKSIIHLLIIQKTLILLCQCIICSSIVTIILRRLEVCGIIIEMK